MVPIDVSRAKVELPDGRQVVGRFVLRNGRAALWTQDVDGNPTRAALASEAAFERRQRATMPHRIVLGGDAAWLVWPLSGSLGGRCCGQAPKGVAAMSLDELLAEEEAGRAAPAPREDAGGNGGSDGSADAS